MTKKDLRGRFIRLATAAAVGGSVFQLSGCDPAVRGELLTGLQSTTTTLSTALISAFFLSLEDESGDASQGGSSALTSNAANTGGGGGP